MDNEKISDDHLRRTAVVYVRQSTLHQVRNNLESQRRQYELRDRAQQLGFQQIELIDEDLGRSGSGSVVRPGFGRLLDWVCKGEVGAVLAFEASRLARNNRDWHHLIDLCAMTDTLVIDHDGVYDSRLLNDRLLLGLKGTMSEFELGLLRQRAQQALREKISRGEVLTMVPVGYTRTAENGLEMIADRQVRQAINGVFRKFDELKSARQVLLWYRQEEIPLPTFRCSGEGSPSEVIWRLPVMNRIISFLKNPCYAGAFVYGRRCTQTTIIEGRARRSSGHWVAKEDWQVLIRDHHDAYISWSVYERNQQLLRENMAMKGKMRSPVKRGPAMLAGLVRCGRCGRTMHVYYSGTKRQVARYFCKGANLNQGTALCISVGALRVDQSVCASALEAIRPVGIEASLMAWEQAQSAATEKEQALRLALEKARYESDRAFKQYNAVDPHNRLVAGELEARWNAKLEEVSELEQRLGNLPKDQALSHKDRRRLTELGKDVELLWNRPEASIELKKRILRTLLEEVIIDVTNSQSPEVIMKLHWAGGVHTELRIPKNRSGMHGRKNSEDVVKVVRDLVLTCNDEAIASILNRRQYRTGTGKPWTVGRVQSLRRSHDIPGYCNPETRNWITLRQAIERLGVSGATVRKMISANVLPAHQSTRFAPWVIEPEALERPDVRAVVATLKKTGRLRLPAEGEEFSFMNDNKNQI